MLRRFSRPLTVFTALLLLAATVPLAQAQPQRAPVHTQPLAPDGSQPGGRDPHTSRANAAVAIDAPKVPIKKTVRVGLLLPLTGRNAELGRMLQDAATIALFDKYSQLSLQQQAIRVELLPKDTGDSPELARAAAAEAIAEGAELLIGPVFSDATEAIAPIAQAKHVPILSFSNNRARAKPGVYLFGFSPQEQAYRVVSFALHHEKERVAVMVPRSSLGDEVLAGARQAAKEAGVKLVAELQYPSQAIGIESALSQLKTGDTLNFDTLLLAEGDTAIETIVRALFGRGISPEKVQFLGTGIWDDADLLRRVNLTGAWFASSPPQLTAQFNSRFDSTYHRAPTRIASLAYDAVALAITLAVTGRPYTEEALTNPTGFMGPANGIFRLRADSTTERGLAVIGVNGTQLQVLSPAPESFR